MTRAGISGPDRVIAAVMIRVIHVVPNDVGDVRLVERGRQGRLRAARRHLGALAATATSTGRHYPQPLH
jgi:hypothetical protein